VVLTGGRQGEAGTADDLPGHRFRGRDGVQLVYREMGSGRPLVLLHGFLSTAVMNWVNFGHAATIAASGHRVIMPDLRGHGDSAAPHAAASYPPDVLVDDGFALVDHLGLSDYDLGGYSLGGRTTLRMLVRGATAGRAIVAGVGLDEIVSTATVRERFRSILTYPGTFKLGSMEWKADALLRTVGGDRVALLQVLDTLVDTPREALGWIAAPTLVLAGAEDDVAAAPLAAAMPNGSYSALPGDHMSAVVDAGFGTAIAEFLGSGAS
jgi:pimeloyl-ACP methyl ester carboxylesterase